MDRDVFAPGRLALLALPLAACSSAPDVPLDSETSLYALVSTIDGVTFLPPLGPDPGPATGPFDASLLGQLRVVLEATDTSGAVATLGSFDQRSSPGLKLLAAHELYWMNVPAAAYFTDPALAYRFRVLLAGVEIARSDMSSQIFEVMRWVPSVPVGVKLRIEHRPAPVLTSLSPQAIVAGADDFTLTVDGASFTSDAVVAFAGRALATTKVSETRLTATVPASQVAVIGRYDVAVIVPAPGGGTSASASFEAYSPVPVLASIVPVAVTAGAPGLVLTLTGSRFAPTARATLDGVELATNVLSSTRLEATIPAASIATAGLLTVRVTNPAPHGGTSEAATLTVQNPAAVLVSLTPAVATAGGAAFTLTLDGSSFAPGAQASLAGAPLATAFSSSNRVIATVPAAAIAAAGTLSVLVSNPAPSLGVSNVLSLLVNNPTPVLSSLSPASVVQGAADTVVTVTGSGFVAGARVTFRATSLVTTFVSPTQLTAVFPASLLAAVGAFDVTVTNPAPAAGTSAALTFTCATPYAANDAAHPAVGCVDLLEHGVARSGLYWIDPNGGSTSDAFQAWCDMDTDGGGWTLVAVIRSSSTFAGGNAVWHSPGTATALLPTSAEGVSVAWQSLTASQLSFHTSSELEGHWASFDLPSARSLLDLVGTTNLASVASGSYRATMTPRGRGAGANTCFDQPWRVTWRDYWSSDGTPDSAIFAPSGAASGRPCGGLGSYATGFGVRTDTSNGFSGYGASFEGTGADPAGNAALTNGQVSIYARERTPAVTALSSALPRSCAEVTGSASGFYTIDPSGGDPADAFSAWCDLTTAGGGWTLVMVTSDGTAWAAGNSIWHIASDRTNALGPTATSGKSFAYSELAGREILIRTQSSTSNAWAAFRSTSHKSLRDLVGADNIQDMTPGTWRGYLQPLAQGPGANVCFAQDWRVSWSNYYSGDSADSSIFAPGGAASGRPCGGSAAYATGIGVRSDTGNGWTGYGASFEGATADPGGVFGLTNGYVAIYVREGAAITGLPASCAQVTGTTSGTYLIDPTGGDSSDAFAAYCDMQTDGGGWTLALASGDTSALMAGAALWHDASGVEGVTPSVNGKSLAYSTVAGTQILFRFNHEAAGNWADFNMPSSQTLLQLVGTTNLEAYAANTYRATLTARGHGSTAHACLAQSWRVSWRDYWSSDGTADSAVFAPSGAASGRPCGGATSYATGIGVRTDSGNGWSGYGGSFEGVGGDGGGNAGLTNGHVTIYVR